MNQIRGFLLERGITIRKGPSYLTTQLQIIFAEGDSSFSGRLLHLILELKHEWDDLERKIEDASAELARIAKQDDGCRRLMEVPGFGAIVLTALVAAIGNGISFRKGRDLARGWEWFPDSTRQAARPGYLASVSWETSTCNA
jgi:transposase